MDDKRMPKISIGITSMTVILCILCLTILSVLSLSTAISERSISQKRAIAVQNYYAAEARATSIVNTLQQKTKSEEDVDGYIAKNNIINIIKEEKYYSFQVPVDDEQSLSVAVDIDDGCSIACWQMISTAEWTPDESLPVWDGKILKEE